MKSIKEKAREYGLEPMANAHYGYDEEDLENSFEAGATYVLDEIEKLLPKVDKSLNDYGKALVWRIKDTVEQLKK